MNLFMYQASAVDTHLNNNWIIYPELFMNGKLSKQNTANSGEIFNGQSKDYILVVYKICTHSLTMLVLPWFQVFLLFVKKIYSKRGQWTKEQRKLGIPLEMPI